MEEQEVMETELDSGEVFCSILREVKTSTREDWYENEKVANYAQWIPT